MRPIASPNACFDPDHNHRFLVERRRISRDDDIQAEGLLTIWLCMDLRRISLLWEDLSRDPSTITPGGPLP